MSEARTLGLGVVVVMVVAALTAGCQASSSQADNTPAAPSATSQGPCTGLDTLTSSDGSEYAQYPVSASNSLGCTLAAGDHGEPVAALQRALALCHHRSVTADGVYGPRTARPVQQLGGKGGTYGPVVAKVLTWPWFSATTRRFTGRCSVATTST